MKNTILFALLSIIIAMNLGNQTSFEEIKTAEDIVEQRAILSSF